MGHIFAPNSSSRQQESLDSITMRTEKSALFLPRQKVGPSSFQACPGLEQAELSYSKCEGSELVRDMSNLPRFLQQMKDDSIQEKALNFGVLDWNRLEKWKYTECMPGKHSKKTSSRSVFPINGLPIMDRNMGTDASSQGRNHLSRPSLYPKREIISSGSHFSSVQREWPVNQEYTAAESGNTRVMQNRFCSGFNVYDRGSPLERMEERHLKRENATSVQGNMRFHDEFGFKSRSCPFISKLHETSPTSIIELSQSNGSRPSVKGSSLSPMHNASFSHGRMGSLAIPESSFPGSPVKSIPLKLDHPSADNFEKDSANAGGRGRSSSPLRRLLDPFLKHKTAQFSQAVPPQNENSLLVTNTKGSSQNIKMVASKVQALLQLSTKNGLPFYKFIVGASNTMLIAAAKKVQISGTPYPYTVYTLYSVCEIKKKSMDWTNQGPVTKNCSLAYNMIGQMRISRPSHPEISCSNSGKRKIRECVLYGADQQKKEIAAIIIHTLSHGEDEDCNGTVVILPGGVHGFPTTGTPSSLLSRWKLGSCDCGGWDTGCNLQIFSTLHGNSKGSRTSTSVDHLDLFLQVLRFMSLLLNPFPLRHLVEWIKSKVNGNQFSKIKTDRALNRLGVVRLQFSNEFTGSVKLNDISDDYLQGQLDKSDPILSMESSKSGIYSIEFGGTVSVTEAFATCVAQLSCTKFGGIVDATDSSHFSEAILGKE